MKREVIKKIKFDSGESWNGEELKIKSTWLVRIDHMNHVIEFEPLNRTAPLADSVFNFLLTDKDIRKELKWARDEYTRTYPFFFKERNGMSGCYDLTMLYARVKHSWAMGAVKHECCTSIHISSNEKMNEGIPDMFSGDLYEVLKYLYGNGDVDYDLLFKKSKQYAKKQYAYCKYHHREVWVEYKERDKANEN